MRYSAIIHLIVIFFAIHSLFYGASYIIGNVYGVAIILFEDVSSFSLFSGAPLYLLSGALSLLLGYIMLVRSVQITGYIVAKSGFESQIKFKGNSKQLLSIFIIFLGLSSLLNASPFLLKNIYFSFVENATGNYLPGEKVSPSNWFLSIIDVILPCLVIIFCSYLTEYFSKNIVLNEEVSLDEQTVVKADDLEMD